MGVLTPRARRAIRRLVRHGGVALAVALAATLATAGAAAGQGPPRNVCKPSEGHVTCFRDRHGLVHGGVVRAEGFSVACRAFRLELFNFLIHKLLPKPVIDVEMELVVAGVCEHVDAAGTVVRRWSTVGGLPLKRISASHYASISAPLPTIAGGSPPNALTDVRAEDAGGPEVAAAGKPTTLLMHYFPLKGQPPETGVPRDLWNAGAADVESALFAQPIVCDPGFVICSAYLKVRHPHPKTRVIAVDMVGAYRHTSMRNNTQLTNPIRRAEFFHEAFSR